MNPNQNNRLNTGDMCTDCKNFIGNIFNSMPFFVKIVISSTIILYLINFFVPYVALFLADIPYFTVYRIQLWRLFTTPFITTGLISVIFSIILWYSKASRLEKEIGTIKYMLIFFMNSFFIQILYCCLMLLFSLIIRSQIPMKMKVTQYGVRNEGIWPILLCDITLLCLSNPEENMKFRFFPCVIKAKYYPLILFLIFTIISGFVIDFENLCGIGFGFLYHYFLKNKLQISNNLATKLANSFLCRWMKNKKGYVNVGGIGSFVLQNNLENVRNVNIGNSSSSNNSNGKGFTAFKGKGVAVGGGDVTYVKRDNSKNENTGYTNVTVSSSDEINSSDSRIDLNNNSPKS